MLFRSTSITNTALNETFTNPVSYWTGVTTLNDNGDEVANVTSSISLSSYPINDYVKTFTIDFDVKNYSGISSFVNAITDTGVQTTTDVFIVDGYNLFTLVVDGYISTLDRKSVV